MQKTRARSEDRAPASRQHNNNSQKVLFRRPGTLALLVGSWIVLERGTLVLFPGPVFL